MKLERLLAPALLCAAVAPLRADVLTVDDTGGAQFFDLQAAIDAAQDGDVVLIAAGQYAAFTITNKDLRLLASGAAPNIASGRIQQLASGKTVVLGFLKLRSAVSSVPPLEITNCAGAVRVQSCNLLGTTIDGEGNPALRVSASSNVFVVASVAQGGNGEGGSVFVPGLGMFGGSARGGAGAQLASSSVAFHTTALTGGTAGTATHWVHCCPTGRGGDGLRGEGSFVFASASPCTGGEGGDLNISSSVCFNSSNFQEMGHGGIGADFSGLAPGQSYFVAPELLGGVHGSTACTYSFPEAPFGPIHFRRGPAGSIAARVGGGVPRSAQMSSLAGASAPLAATFQGAPFETVDVYVSPAADFVWSAASAGVWGIALASALPPLPVGTLDGNGALAASIALPPLPTGTPNQSWFVQPLFTATNGVQRLGSAHCVTRVP